MRIKITSFLVLMLIIHIGPLITSCCLGPTTPCEEPEIIYSAVERAEVSVYSFDQRTWNTINEDPFDRQNLKIGITLKYPDELDNTPYVYNRGSILSSAYADVSPCREYQEIQLTEFIMNIQVLLFDELEESTSDISTDFLAEGNFGDLYYEVSDYLLMNELHGIRLVYKIIPPENNLSWIVRTTLSDERVLSDTLRFSLQ